jgi:hypothetical protein
MRLEKDARRWVMLGSPLDTLTLALMVSDKPSKRVRQSFKLSEWATVWMLD